MSAYMAEVVDGIVVRVIVAPDVAWPAANLGGTWVQTADPYRARQTVAYCGPGWGHDATAADRFAPRWTQAVADEYERVRGEGEEPPDDTARYYDPADGRIRQAGEIRTREPAPTDPDRTR